MKDKANTRRQYDAIWYGLVLILTSLPMVLPGIEGHFGQDLGFHLNRIEGLYVELKNGVFPVRMQSFWMDGYGYPVSIYYGDLFLYFPALLRLLGVPVVAAYKLYLLGLNAATILVCRYAFGRMMGDASAKQTTSEMAVFLMTLAYCTATYRMENLYVRTAVGEYTAMVFLPLVALAVYRIYGGVRGAADSSISDRREDGKTILLLTAAMAGILYSHMLTLEIVCIVLMVYILFHLRQTLQKRVIRIYVVAACLTILLGLHFLVPFLDYMMTQDVYLNHALSHARNIQGSGLYWWEYFAFFRMPFSNVEGSGVDRMLVIPGMLLLLVFFSGLGTVAAEAVRRLRLGKHRESGEGDASLCLLIGLIIAITVLFFISSVLFPWDFLAAHSRIGTLLAQVQFPWRYIGIADLLLCLLFGVLLRHWGERGIRVWFPLSLLLALLMSGIFFGWYAAYAERDAFANTEDLDTFDMGFIEYLRYDTDRDLLDGKVRVVSGDAEVSVLSRKGTKMELSVKTSPDMEATLELPYIHYKGYHMLLKDGREISLRDGSNFVIAVTIPAGYDGRLSLTFRPPLYWTAASMLSLSVAILMLSVVLRRIYEKRQFAGTER